MVVLFLVSLFARSGHMLITGYQSTSPNSMVAAKMALRFRQDARWDRTYLWAMQVGRRSAHLYLLQSEPTGSNCVKRLEFRRAWSPGNAYECAERKIRNKMHANMLP